MVINKKIRRHSGRKNVGFNFNSDIINYCPIETYYDEWQNYRDGWRNYSDNTKLKLNKFKDKNKKKLLVRKAKKNGRSSVI